MNICIGMSLPFPLEEGIGNYVYGLSTKMIPFSNESDAFKKVIMQIGETRDKPKNAKYFRFASAEKMDQLYEDARVVVCHAGVGSILTALGHGKPIIAVPRRKKYGEHVDDHQLDIAGEMEKEGRITVVCDVDELERALNDVSTASEMEVESGGELVRALKMYLEELDAKN